MPSSFLKQEKVLQRHARRLLTKEYAAPQRYGTAFHVTAPYPDVREMPPHDFGGVTMTGAALGLPAPRSTKQSAATAAAGDGGFPARQDPSPAVTRDTFFQGKNTDPYLLWHLSHIDTLPVKALTIPAGSSRELTFAALKSARVSNVVYLALEEDSALTIYDTAVAHEIFLQRVVVVQRARSRFTYWGVRGQNAFANEQLTVCLRGEQAVTSVTHLLVGAEASQADLAVTAQHIGQHTQSDIVVRALAAAKARTIYRGLIDVQATATGARGYQQGRALLTSRQAVVDMLPQLEIATNDVRCSHGVSTTHLDDAALFYLRSRGLSEIDARKLAVRGFFHHEIPMPRQSADDLEHLLAGAL